MHLRPNKLPHQWLLDVECLRMAGFEAVLAGGCLRDLYCAKQPKDIDIFILSKNLFMTDKIKRALGWGAWHEKQYQQFSPVYQIDYVIERSEEGKPPLQIIGVQDVQTPFDLISKFDYGLCQIAFDGAQLLYTQAFERDFLQGTFTLTHAHAYDRSIERYKSWIEEKYKGWPFVASGIVLREQLIRSLKGNHGKSSCEISPLEI